MISLFGGGGKETCLAEWLGDYYPPAAIWVFSMHAMVAKWFHTKNPLLSIVVVVVVVVVVIIIIIIIIIMPK